MEKRRKSNKKILKLPMTGTGRSVLLVSIVIAIAFTSIAVTPVIAQEEEAEVTVTVNAPEYVEEGETFEVFIDVDYIEDFNAGQFDLTFDHKVVKVKKVSEGCIDDIEIPISHWDKWMDSDTIRVMPMLPIKVMPDEDETVSGSGYIAKIEFKVVGDIGDKCTLELDEAESFLSNIIPEEIPVKEWIGAEITVGTAKEEEEEEEEDPPEITGIPEEAAVSSEEGESMDFEITVDQRVDISWQMNGTEAQTEEDVTGAVFTKTADAGTWNVSAIAISTETGLSSMRTWIWSVTSTEAPEETPTPTPSLAPGVTPTPTPTLAPGETPLQEATPAVKTTPKPTAPPSPEGKATPTPTSPGFEVVFAIATMLAIGYPLLRRR